jgi:hypothetical protein
MTIIIYFEKNENVMENVNVLMVLLVENVNIIMKNVYFNRQCINKVFQY